MCVSSMKKSWQRSLLVVSIAALLTGCATSKHPDDPWESYNRVVFKFNEQVDKVALKPVAKVYNAVVPAPVNKGVSNFYANLKMPLTIVNDVVQLKPKQAVADTWRFAINSTFGLGGLFDVASEWGLEDHPQDFGMTLARWGIWKESAYLVAPFWGPTTIRDSLMVPLDLTFTPWPYVRPLRINLALYALDVVDQRAQLLKADDLIENVAVDQYVFIRDAYMQHRRHQINPAAQTDASQSELERAFEGDF